ncbi:MAG: hypothetical protein GEU96_21165 [Propionibacteriales bacterium]|nr:hypothetical protein [Propionibacteriales bacterium]
MPPEPPASDPAALTRRAVLTAALALPPWMLVSGCTLSGPRDDSGSDDSGGDDVGRDNKQAADEDPDVAVLDEAVAVVTGLVTGLEQSVAERPTLARQVDPVLEAHRRHAQVLGEARPSGSAGTPSGSASPSRPPVGPRQTLARLARAERQAAARHLEHTARAKSGQFARLLASIAAAEAQYGVVLGKAAR